MILRQTDMTTQSAHTLTGHGGFAQHPFRIKPKKSLYCVCDPENIQDVLHVLEGCDMFLWERAALEAEMDEAAVPENYDEPTKRKKLTLRICNELGHVFALGDRRALGAPLPARRCYAPLYSINTSSISSSHASGFDGTILTFPPQA
ncbi:hypothetical protein EVAR_68014_1 [Eumeta japonica]|uniref:Uncharacterized protein n=1 Tax=Eumeta variegata TaxID=151549 RepID=A0A4C1ZHW3_EUMVA|nr:hypothetical protein EVAR_68014_1 [Eumeta japonica]